MGGVIPLQKLHISPDHFASAASMLLGFDVVISYVVNTVYVDLRQLAGKGGDDSSAQQWCAKYDDIVNNYFSPACAEC